MYAWGVYSTVVKKNMRLSIPKKKKAAEKTPYQLPASSFLLREADGKDRKAI